MSTILLLPGFISLVLVIRGRIETAFLSVYLPSLLLLPEDYSVRIPHFPPLSAAEFALIPVGIVALMRCVKSGPLRLMDALVVLFSLSFSVSEILHEPIINDGIFAAVGNFVSIVLAYMAGRQLIEPDLRSTVVRRIVILTLLPGPICLYQWMGRSPYGIVGNRILKLPMVDYNPDSRSGHGKAGGAFMSSEIAGIAFGMIFALNAWLVFLQKRKMRVNLGKRFSKLEKYHVPALLLVFYIVLTQERGPLMALPVVLLILQVPKFKRTKLVTGVVAALLIVAALGAKQYFKVSDLQGYEYQSASEQTRSTFYRQKMNRIYQAIAEEGGWTGWSVSGIPHFPGMDSIDNDFLLVHLSQGELGYILFVLITTESVRTAIARLWSLRALEDRAFAASVLAALACLWTILYTVYMGEQLPQFAFLVIGWGQSIAAVKTSKAAVAGVEAHSKFVFRRVFN